MVFILGALATGVLVFMAATSPRAFLVVLALALVSFFAWYILSPTPTYENEPPPRVMAP